MNWFLDPARGTAARLWDWGSIAFTVLLGHAPRVAVELPPVIVTQADGTVTVSGCGTGWLTWPWAVPTLLAFATAVPSPRSDGDAGGHCGEMAMGCDGSFVGTGNGAQQRGGTAVSVCGG